MQLDPIIRDSAGLAQTRFCRETPDGGLDITFRADTPPYQLTSENIAPDAAFAHTWIHLTCKNWFTPEVAADFVNVVSARWLAKAQGCN